MEQKINKVNFEIIVNHKDLLVKAIESYNKIQRTDFALVEFLVDEVNFATIEGQNVELSDIYKLGEIYGKLWKSYQLQSGEDW
jgi:hypothetical protein